MKKSFLFLFTLLATGLFAQKTWQATSNKTAPPNDPTQLQGPPADHQAPQVTCLNGLAANIMPTGMIQLWASDFLLSVSDNESPVSDIKIGIRKEGTGVGFPLDTQGNPVQSVVFDCNEVGDQTIELWAMDLAGNADYCLADILLQDFLQNCANAGGGNVKICVAQLSCDSMASGLEEIVYEITTQMPPEPPSTGFRLGNENCFDEYFPPGTHVEITPVKDDNQTNGVTTYDLVLLSKHIHGIQPFTEPWQWVAADADRDGEITLNDSIVLLNLLLGIYTELPTNMSWRFVLEDYQFPSPNPLSQPFPESFFVNDLQDTMYNIRFSAIKIGDLNCTAVSNSAHMVPTERRARPEAVFIGSPQPNPSTGVSLVPLQLEQAQTVRLELMDLSGQLLFRSETTFPAGPAMLDIPATASDRAGIYLWRINAGENTKTGKLIRL